MGYDAHMMLRVGHFSRCDMGRAWSLQFIFVVCFHVNFIFWVVDFDVCLPGFLVIFTCDYRYFVNNRCRVACGQPALG